jgi:DNA-binding CsgD family transcriptional regulator
MDLANAARNVNIDIDSAGLTPAESAFAKRLAAGHSIDEICEALGIRHTTARTHLRHLFQKTHTRRQAELVSWLLRQRS